MLNSVCDSKKVILEKSCKHNV